MILTLLLILKILLQNAFASVNITTEKMDSILQKWEAENKKYWGEALDTPVVIKVQAEKHNRENPLDLTPKQKKQLKTLKPIYARTKNIIRMAENPNLVKSKVSCKHPDKNKFAIGYGDNYFLINNSSVECITNDYAEWLLHHHLENEVVSKIKATDFFKKWGYLVGDEYLANLYSKVYNVGFTAFLKSRTYKLISANPFTNNALIKKEWLKWENKTRREQEIIAMHNNKVYKKNLAMYTKKRKTLNNALKEVGIV
jgi:hypothetical protein